MENYTYYEAHAEPFSLHGLVSGEGYARLPEAMLSRMTPRFAQLARNTSGGRIRFRTDAKTVSVRITLADPYIKTLLTPLNTAGAELFQGNGKAMRRIGVLRPQVTEEAPFAALAGYSLRKISEQTVDLSGRMEDCTLYLPSYGPIERVEIGFPEGSAPHPASPYGIPRPIVFYGSSITQGACAGRPSLTYPARVCAALDADFINLGFAGHAKGEPEIARYIASLPMSVFVMDYDHNAPDRAHLAATHEHFLDIILEAQPDLPVLVLTRPYVRDTEETDARYEIIAESCRHLTSKGYRISLLDGRTFFPADHPDDCLMDLVHPNDQGFHLMAEKVLPRLQALLG